MPLITENNRLTRRGFIGSLTASVSLAPACLWGAERRLSKISFVVVSDTHVGYKNKTGAAKAWERTATEICKAPGDMVLHLGDIVDKCQETQYPIYLDARKKIGKPVYEIPGNHDPEKLFSKYIREEIDTVVDHQWLRFLLLNDAHTDSHDGFLTDEQLAWIDARCLEAKKAGQFVIMCLHVPVHKNRHPDRGWYVKPEQGQSKLYEILEKHRGRVVSLFHGHFHNGIRGWDDHGSLHEIAFPSVLYNQNRRLAEQKAPGYNLPEFRPGYTLVTLERGKMRLRYKPTAIEECKDKSLVIVSSEN